MSYLSEKIPPHYIVKSNNTLFFSNILSSKQKNGHIIIFDDLERASPDIKFETICGIIESLIKFGFFVVCIVNSDRIQTSSFNELKEKTFDKIVIVEPDYTVLPNIIQDDNIQSTPSILKDADDNLRIIIRATAQYKLFIHFLSDNGFNDFFKRSQITYTQLFRSIVIATNCFSLPSPLTPNFDHKEFAKIYYDGDVSAFGVGAANKLFLLFENNKENSTLKDLAREFIHSYISGSFINVLSNYYSLDEDDLVNSYPFNTELFYLDDKGKRAYLKAFFNRLDEFDFSNQRHLSIVRNLLLSVIDEISDSDQNKIINQIIKTVKREELSDSLIYLASEDKNKNDMLGNFKKRFSEAIKNKIEKDRNISLNKAFSEGDYVFLTNYLYDNRYATNEKAREIASIFANEDFFLPDLSKTIDYQSWSYCHEIARFVAQFDDYVELFINVLKRQCSRKKSKTLIERCNALVFYNFKNSPHFCRFEFSK